MRKFHYLLSMETQTRKFMMGSDIFRGSVYGVGHPLNIARVWPVIDICFDLGWLSDANYLQVAPAPAERLALFHTSDYITALFEAEQKQSLDSLRMERHRIGKDNNPIFPQIYSRPATAAHASILAAEMLANGKADIIYNPAGGTHHGMPDRANGFCFVNDPALAICYLLQAGIDRIAYIDIDAHHPDGVEAHLSGDARVRLFSVHEENRWPRTGRQGDKAGGFASNYTLPRGAGDAEFLAICSENILPELDEFAPEIIILQAGCDGLRDDPQSGLLYSNIGYWRSISLLLSRNIPALVLGGGGYNPYTTARAWVGVWGIISGHDPVSTLLPPASIALLRSLEWHHRLGRNPPESWFIRLADNDAGNLATNHGSRINV